MRCDQLDDLLSLVVELKEEVERLRSITECEREIGWWSNSLAPLKQQEQMEAQERQVIPHPLVTRQKEGT